MGPINIHSTNVQIELDKGKYHIYIIGGWGIRCRNFTIKFRNATTDKDIPVEKVFMGMKTFINNKRAKKIFYVHVSKAGLYRVDFHNPTSLEVRGSDLGLVSFITTPRPNSGLSILVSKNNGMSMFKE